MESKTKNIILISTLVVLLMLASPAYGAIETLIKRFEENNVPALEAYDDGGGTYTIGFGSTFNFDQNRPVQPGDVITSEQAYRYMRNEIETVVTAINSFVTVPINQNQLSALASLGYNIGTTALKNSTLIRLLNEGSDKSIVADRFTDWVNSRNRWGVLVYNPGLYNRRVMEQELFLS